MHNVTLEPESGIFLKDNGSEKLKASMFIFFITYVFKNNFCVLVIGNTAKKDDSQVITKFNCYRNTAHAHKLQHLGYVLFLG